eukprot:3142-Ditylum_brightwellii.AAC.1
MPVPTYNIGTKHTVAGFPSNMTLSIPSTTNFHVITEQELKDKNIPYPATNNKSNCDTDEINDDTTIMEWVLGKYPSLKGVRNKSADITLVSMIVAVKKSFNLT